MVRGVLKFLWSGVVKVGALIGNAVFHCEAEGLFVVVPLVVDPYVQVTFLVDYYVVVLFDGVDQVIFVVLAFVLDAKIFN